MNHNLTESSMSSTEQVYKGSNCTVNVKPYFKDEKNLYNILLSVVNNEINN